MLQRKFQLKKLLLSLLLFLLQQGTAHARSVLITWDDNSENEEGFVVERTISDDCVGSWEVIAYTGINQTSLVDTHIPGACYRVAAYNQGGPSMYSSNIRIPLDPRWSNLHGSN
jgi:hypothetical protein